MSSSWATESLSVKGSQIIHDVISLTRRVEEGAHIAPLLTSHLQGTPVARRGRITDLVYGIERWRLTLDYVIDTLSNRPPKHLHPFVFNVLRCGIYQLAFTPRPPYAVVDEAVEAVKAKRLDRIVPYVNALLRKVAALPSIWELLPPGGEPVRYLSLRYAHPLWLVDRWIDHFGRFQTEEILKENQVPPRLVLHCNPRRGSRDEVMQYLEKNRIIAEKVPDLPNALTITHGNPIPLILQDPGRFTVQDCSTQTVGQLAAALAGKSLLDACGAPGGKSIVIQNVGKPALHVLQDLRPGRLAMAIRNAKGLGMESLRFLLGDASRPAHPPATFDTILLDAPCTGTGTLNKNPEIKWRLEPAMITDAAERQRKMLTAQLEILKPGGTLLYATCSMEPEENAEMVLSVVKHRNDCSIRVKFEGLPDTIISHADDNGVFTWFPTRTSSGMTAIIIQRQ